MLTPKQKNDAYKAEIAKRIAAGITNPDPETTRYPDLIEMVMGEHGVTEEQAQELLREFGM